MDFNEVRRILQRLDLPKSGFEDMLGRLDELKDRASADEASLRRRQSPKLAKLRSIRAA